MEELETLNVRRVNGFGSNPLRFEGTKEEIQKAFYAGMGEATTAGNAIVTYAALPDYSYTAPMDVIEKIFSAMLTKTES